MPWNADDRKGNKEKNEWGDRSEQGPPDISDLLSKLAKSFQSKKSGGGNDNGGAGGMPGAGIPKQAVMIVLALFLLAWLFSGVYIINEGQRGVVLQFGSYLRTTGPGPHWHIPYPIQSAEKVDVDRNRSTQTKARMLTQDENIVEVELATQYRVKNAADYLFNVRQPDVENSRVQNTGTLSEVMGSSLREVVGKSKMDYILGEGRADIAFKTKELMQQILDDYVSGMEVISVNLQQSQPPEAVQDAFADAIKAREDEVRYRNEAETYANGIVPQARGEAARMTQEAAAYREKVVANAEGESRRFNDVRSEYEMAPVVTKKRMYLQAMEKILGRVNKIVIDVDKGNNLFLMPLDKLMGGGQNQGQVRMLGSDADIASGGDTRGALGRAVDAGSSMLRGNPRPSSLREERNVR